MQTPVHHANALENKALEIGGFLRKHFLDERGVVFTHLDKTTLRVPEESFFPEPVEKMSPGQDWVVPGYQRSEVAGYENCGMCTGAYLLSMLWRYRVTGEARVLEEAQQQFEALNSIFEHGRGVEEGFFPKIYGNRFSKETSTDQVLYAACALEQYAEFASPAQAAQIEQMIVAMVRFWVRRGYIYSYWHVTNMEWPLMRFPPLLLLARQYSDDPLFESEYRRLLQEGVSQLPEWAWLDQKKNGRRPISDYEKARNVLMISNMADCLTMDVMNLDLLLRLDPDHPAAPEWRQGIETMWDHARLTLAQNGKCYTHVLVDRDSGQTRRPGGYPDEGPPGSETGWSTMIARGAVMAARYLPHRRTEIRSAVLRILEQIDIADMTYLDEPGRLPPRERFKTRMLSGDSIANWLWAYWQGRFDGLLE